MNFTLNINFPSIKSTLFSSEARHYCINLLYSTAIASLLIFGTLIVAAGMFSLAKHTFLWIKEILRSEDQKASILANSFFIESNEAMFQELLSHASSNQVRDHIQNAKTIYGILSSNHTTESIINKIHQQKLEGYVHVNEWENNYLGLVANMKLGLNALHESYQQFGDKETLKTIKKTSNACFHAVVESLQSLLCSKQAFQFLFIVNFDPNHTPDLRAVELVRVYINEKAAEILTTKGQSVDQNNILQIPYEEIPNLTADSIVNWCKEHNYIGPGTTSVNFLGGSRILDEECARDNISQALRNIR